MNWVGDLANTLLFSPSRKITFLGAVILSAFLIFLTSMPLRLPVGTIFLSEKYSVSIRSKLLGAVTARLVTSSVVTATYWILMPVSFSNFSAIVLSWFTAVPR